MRASVLTITTTIWSLTGMALAAPAQQGTGALPPTNVLPRPKRLWLANGVLDKAAFGEAPMVSATAALLWNQERQQVLALDPRTGARRWRTRLPGAVGPGGRGARQIGLDLIGSHVLAMDQTSGRLMSLALASGKLEWTLKLDCASAPRLKGESDGAVASCESKETTDLVNGRGDTYLIAIDLAAGKELWRQRVEALLEDFAANGKMVAVVAEVVPALGTEDQAVGVRGLDQDTGASLWHATFAADRFRLSLRPGFVIIEGQRTIRALAEGDGRVVWTVATEPGYPACPRPPGPPEPVIDTQGFVSADAAIRELVFLRRKGGIAGLDPATGTERQRWPLPPKWLEQAGTTLGVVLTGQLVVAYKPEAARIDMAIWGLPGEQRRLVGLVGERARIGDGIVVARPSLSEDASGRALAGYSLSELADAAAELPSHRAGDALPKDAR
jgi:hypothetical protein